MRSPATPWQPAWLKRFLRKAGVRFATAYVRFRGRRGGLPAVQRDGERMGRLHYHVAFIHRRTLKSQIAQLFDTRIDDPKITAWLKQACRINDRAVLEVLAKAVQAVTADEVTESVNFKGSEAMVEQLGSGQGAILLGMHSGNVLAMLFKLAHSGLPITVIGNQPKRIADGFFEDFFAGTDAEIIPGRPESRAFYKLNKALQRGRAVYIPIDQIHKNGGIPTRFLGKRVPMPGGAPALARKYGVPIYPVLLEAVEPKWQFRIGEGIPLPPDQEKHQDVADLAAIIDAHIRQNPQLWSWHHRRWIRYPFE